MVKTFVFVFIRKLDPLPFFAHFVLSMKKFLLVLCKDSKTSYIEAGIVRCFFSLLSNLPC